MNLLVATRETQGSDESDFDDGIVPGEIVEPMSVCDRDLYVDTLPCGCGRAFIGMTSAKTTTTATIADINIDRDTLRTLVAAHHADADADEVAAMTEQLGEYGDEHDVGTIVTIWRYELQARP